VLAEPRRGAQAAGESRLLIDLSAWARSSHPDAKERWAELLSGDRLLAHPMFAVEMLHNAITPKQYGELRRAIETGFDWVWPDEETARVMVRIQERMASTAPTAQRVKTVDIFTAALASQRSCGVLHYDGDYDVIDERGGEPFQNEWLAERGTLDSAGVDHRAARGASRGLDIPPPPNV
jgi:predicted nucleic acid-binding protein